MINISEINGTIESVIVNKDKGRFTVKLKEAQTIFSSFNMEIAKSIFEGDYVKLEYVTNEKDGRTYYNISNATVIKQGAPIEESFKKSSDVVDVDIKEVMKQSFRDAKEIFAEAFPEVGPEELTKVALSLFIQKMRQR